MSRFNILEKEINKGIKIDEKSGVTLDNWSPNNVRRLIIGSDCAIVQYHVTGGKYGKLISPINFKSSIKDDMEALQNGSYVSILKVLTKNRICSSVEEIIFCTKNYPSVLLNKDIDFNILKGSSTMENRFVRLNTISIVNTGVSEMLDLVNGTKRSDELLIDKLSAKNIPHKPIYEGKEGDWWKRTSLRGNYYGMDVEEGVLWRHFNKLKELKEAQERENKLDQIQEKRCKEVIEKDIKPVLDLIGLINKLIDQTTLVYSSSGVIDKAEWSKYFSIKSLVGIVGKEIRSIEGLDQKIRKIDFELIEKNAKKFVGETEANTIESFEQFVMTSCLNIEGYKRESNKSDIITSMKMLQILIVNVFDAIILSVYIGLVQFLNRNGRTYIKFYLESLDIEGSDIMYTRVIIEKMNKILSDEISAYTLKLIGGNEVLKDNFTIVGKYTTSQAILKGLLTIAKEG